jgi:hypothetical protein
MAPYYPGHSVLFQLITALRLGSDANSAHRSASNVAGGEEKNILGYVFWGVE